jgi:hypothetical protein
MASLRSWRTALYLRRLRLPPRDRQALGLVQTATGERGVVPIGVTNRRPALIESWHSTRPHPPSSLRGRYSGWFGIGGRRLFLRCTGHRSPTGVFEGGLTTDWYELQNQLSGRWPGWC